MDFAHHESPNPTRVVCDEGGIRRQVVRNPSHMETIQNAFFYILYSLRHVSHAKYTAQSLISWQPCEMDLSHNCSAHGESQKYARIVVI